ncbi:MAG: hypothetical protein WC683_04090 [bacterium]
MNITVHVDTVVRVIALSVERFKDGAFGASSVLAEIMGIPKEKALDMIIAEREGRLRR